MPPYYRFVDGGRIKGVGPGSLTFSGLAPRSFSQNTRKERPVPSFRILILDGGEGENREKNELGLEIQSRLSMLGWCADLKYGKHTICESKLGSRGHVNIQVIDR